MRAGLRRWPAHRAVDATAHLLTTHNADRGWGCILRRVVRLPELRHALNARYRLLQVLPRVAGFLSGSGDVRNGRGGLWVEPEVPGVVEHVLAALADVVQGSFSAHSNTTRYDTYAMKFATPISTPRQKGVSPGPLITQAWPMEPSKSPERNAVLITPPPPCMCAPGAPRPHKPHTYRPWCRGRCARPGAASPPC